MLPTKREGERVVAVWEPFRDLRNMHDEMDRLFSSFWPNGGRELTPAAEWMPAADLYEDKEQIVVKLELPGVRKEDVSISLTEDTLTIKGERKTEKEERRENYFRIEGKYGSFLRMIELPRPVKADAIKAEYKDGILKIVLPKAEDSRTREIKIDVK
ncbi:MAG TPA: Hsp20/alpha crystallin family protein [Nitrospiria bacterium]|nr:Hsp20/alpha crystallin family protein [Nitrospiria bacterium]